MNRLPGFCKYQLLHRVINLHNSIQSLHRYLPKLTVMQLRHKTTSAPPSNEEIDVDQPIKFSTSRASKWKARDTYGGGYSKGDTQLWYQPFVVNLSLAVFLVYFCILREENDIDNKLKMTLYDHIDGLEEKQLELSLEHSSGEDTTAILKRLEELRDITNAGVDSQ